LLTKFQTQKQIDLTHISIISPAICLQNSVFVARGQQKRQFLPIFWYKCLKITMKMGKWSLETHFFRFYSHFPCHISLIHIFVVNSASSIIFSHFWPRKVRRSWECIIIKSFRKRVNACLEDNGGLFEFKLKKSSKKEKEKI